MTSQSIYTEYANITPEHKTWLDGCGAKWLQGERFRQFPIFYSKIVFEGKYFYNYDVPNMTRPCAKTGSEFCERVAEILGIEKPVFGDKPEVEGKGLAIEVSQLREEDIETLVEMCGESWAEVPKQALKNKNERYLFYKEGGLDCHHKMGLKNLGVTITESVPEFMRYVAKKTGKLSEAGAWSTVSNFAYRKEIANERTT